MSKRKKVFILVFTFVLLIFTSCNRDMDNGISGYELPDNNGGYTDSVQDAAAENCGDHEDLQDYIWENSEVIQIVLQGTSISVDPEIAAVEGSKLTITSAGTYNISGTLTDGQIIVDTQDQEIVRLILNGVNITSSSSAPIFIKSSAKTIIVLSEGSENYLTDGESYIFENSEEDEPKAAIFSRDDLTIYGSGSLTVDGNYNDGISCKDGLIIKSGIITVNSVDDGIRGKDYLIVKGGNINVNAEGDGLKSDNDEDASKGYVYIETGILNIISGKDAVTGETDVLISNGEIFLSSGGGSNSNISGSISAKGIKAVVDLIIDDGTMTISSADDAIHSNGNLAINGGTFIISSGDDGIHADSDLGVNGGNINITKSFEGIESRTIITINDGDIHIIASDDGLNVAGGKDGSGFHGGPGGGMPSSGDYYLYINGGYTVINSTGDGIDVNGSIVMTGGDVIINGPTSNMNGALDYDALFKITGGFILGAGSSGMAQAPGSSSTQYSILLKFNSTQQAGGLVHFQTSGGDQIFSFEPVKKYQSIVFSSSILTKGMTYDVYTGGSSTGTANDGLYTSGTYSPGTKYTSFTISGIVTGIRK